MSKLIRRFSVDAKNDFQHLENPSRHRSNPWNSAGGIRAGVVIIFVLALGIGVAGLMARRVKTQNSFVGSRECRDCHEAFYQKWATSHHGLAMQPYTPALAQTKFIQQTNAIAIGPRQYHYDQQAGAVIEVGPQGSRKYPVLVVMGGKDIYYLLTPLERGHLQVLPVAFDVRRRTWIDTAASAIRHMSDRRDEALDWTDRLYTFNTACFACHVSQLTTRYNSAEDSYATTWLEPGINCEVCHGPGAEHVRVCRAAPTNQPPKDLRITIVKTMPPAQRNDLCATCHAKLSPLTTDFKPGDRFFDHFDLTSMEDSDFYPDGRDLGENYTMTGWRMNRCGRASNLDCVHCHTSSGRNRFPGALANQACLPCHKDKVDAPSRHTHHPSATNSPTCISCHMPMTEFGRMRRSDHSFRPPMPAAAKQFGSPLACLQCHTERNAEWANAQVHQWHATDYQAETLRWAALVQAARHGDWSQSTAMLSYLTKTNREEMVAVALIRLLGTCPDTAKYPALVQATSDASPLIRAAAAAGLEGRFAGDELAALLRAGRDDFRVVRIRAAQALAGYPLDRLAPNDRTALMHATAELEQSLRLRSDDAVSLYNLANYHMTRGDLNTAITNFESSLRLRPDFIPSAVNIALALNQLGRNTEAEHHLRAVLVHTPTNAAVLLNLALLLGEQGRTDEARQAWLQVLKHDPHQATAAFNLAVITGATDPKTAANWAGRAAEWAPHEWKYFSAHAFYLRQSGDTAGALSVLGNFVQQNPASGDGWLGLANAQAEAGQTGLAVETCHRALARPNLPPEVRDQLTRLLVALDAAP